MARAVCRERKVDAEDAHHDLASGRVHFPARIPGEVGLPGPSVSPDTVRGLI